MTKVRLALELNPAAINVHGENEKTALHLAVEQGFNDITMILIASGADINAVDIKTTPPSFSCRAKQS